MTALTSVTAATTLASTDPLLATVGANSRKITWGNLARNLPLGTVAAPGLAFVGDQDTGLYGDGANGLFAAVGGALSASLIGDVTTWGIGAGATITSGTNLTVIGAAAEPSAAAATNEITLGDASVTVLRSARATTVAALPSAATVGAGARAFVTDATATTFASTAAGGGANAVPVISNGTNWIIG